MKSFLTSITVPGTTANIGPGFDCLGAALTLYNHFTFTRLEKEEKLLKIQVTGLEADRVTTDESNLVYQGFLKTYQHLGQAIPPVEIEITLGVPLARGLGSSATAIVGGILGANELAGKPLEMAQVMELAIAMEGHPDNVVPALLGNCQLSCASEKGDWTICQVPWHENLVPVLAIPNFELSTEEARTVLPSSYSRSDAIFNLSHVGLLLRGLETNREDWLKVALADKIHQPYRQKLIRGYSQVYEAALAAGAYGMVISGAGPTLLALGDKSQGNAIATAMKNAWQKEGVEATVQPLDLDRQGATIKH